MPPKIAIEFSNTNAQKERLSIEEFTKNSILALQNDHTEKEIAEILGISRKKLWKKENAGR